MDKNTTGSNNTSLGYYSNLYNQEGSNNTILGYQAGKGTALHNKYGNVFLGYMAGYSEHGSNKLYIENSNSTSPLIYGEFDNDIVSFNANVGIGTSAPAAKLHVLGPTRIDSGRIEFVNTGNSVFIGAGAGANDDFLDNYNVAVGDSALYSNTTGFENVANGYRALYSNNNGYNNVANGSNALNSNLDGSYNVAIGDQALYSNTAGYYNVANGYWALKKNTTGYYNTVIGYKADVADTALTNATAIGANSIVSQSNSMVLGSIKDKNGATADTKVGIGTSAPDEKLDVKGNAKADTMFAIAFSSNSPLLLQTDGTTRIYVDDATGNVGVGTISPNTSSILDVTSTEKGILIPRVALTGTTDKTTISSPAVSLMIYNTATAGDVTPGFYYWNDIAWAPVSETADGSETQVTAGTNVSVTGVGTTASPYVVNASGAITYSVGDFAQGGIVFWVDETGQHGLVCAKENQSTPVRWYAGTHGNTHATGDGLYAGEANTSIIIAAQLAIGDDGNTYAARICNEYNITEGGIKYGDWYLPSREELNLMYQNKATIISTANANGGTAFGVLSFWSSSEYSNDYAYGQTFVTGFQFFNLKSNTFVVRAIRAF
ncbi:MAG: DUF1566 domain-containing protein [Gammaproteobacteria bacterium]|nr:DUF1566 domain-containing protein [Gammaproteobacteria bacterium]